MKKIIFEYRDRYTNGKWNKQSCIVESISECIKIYGLGKDCKYHILEVKDV